MNNRNFSKAVEAVSPVVATLLLVLVAAGAAIGFGVFLNGFQKDTQKNVKSDVSTTCLQIGGSSTVFEFTAKAIPLFEGSQGGCHVENNSGGSGAGVIAAGTCKVDIGAASRAVKTTELAAYPDCDGTAGKDFGRGELVSTQIAWDAVAPMAKTGHCGGTTSIALVDLQNLWGLNGGVSGYVLQAGGIAPGADNLFQWGELFPACVGQSSELNTIKLVSRSDDGGTMEVFCQKLLGSKVCPASGTNQDKITSTDFPGVTFTGLGGNQDAQLKVASGSTAASSTTDYLGYSSIGRITVDPTLTYFQVGGVNPTDLTKIRGCTSGCYAGARPLNYVTVGEPQGVAKQFIDFVMQPRNNQAISTASDFISIYP
jgi:phosphate transport system substrate-binding protein